MEKQPLIFSLTSNIEVTKEICDILKVDVGKCEVKHFADGEIIVETLQSVRGRHVYIIQSTCTPVTEKLMELLIFVDALRRASASEITAIVPYYGYARQDRQAKAREPITARLVADLFKTAGVDRVITLDLHAPQIQGFFTCPVDNISAVGMIGKYFRDKLKGENIVVVSPDHGGVTRARNLAQHLNSTIAIFDKRRPRPNVAEITNIIGEVNGKVAVIIDDIIDTGGTIVAAINELAKRGCTKVYAACTHPVFSNNAIEKIENSAICELVTTNTIPLARKSEKIKVLSIGPMIAKTIQRIEAGESIASIYDLYK